MSFSTRITVRFGDTDSAGLVYYPNLFHYFHVAMEEFFAARCGIPYHRLMAEERVGFPIVKAETEFMIPLVYGDVAVVEVSVVNVGRSSATFEHSIRREEDDDEAVCVRARLVHVAMNLDERRAVPISDQLRRAFAESTG